VFHDAHDAVQFRIEFRRRFDRSKGDIENIVTAIGDERAAIGREAKRGNAAQLFQPVLRRLPAEWLDFNGHGETAAQPIDQFCFVHHDHETRARAGHDLLAQKISAAALYQIEAADFDFVRAVDGDVNPRMLSQCRQGNADAACERGRFLRGRNPDDAQVFFRDALAHCGDGQRRGRSRTEADDHSALELRDGRGSRSQFELIDRRGIERKIICGGFGHDALDSL
jgi:hypothetical protein